MESFAPYSCTTSRPLWGSCGRVGWGGGGDGCGWGWVEEGALLQRGGFRRRPPWGPEDWADLDTSQAVKRAGCLQRAPTGFGMACLFECNGKCKDRHVTHWPYLHRQLQRSDAPHARPSVVCLCWRLTIMRRRVLPCSTTSYWLQSWRSPLRRYPCSTVQHGTSHAAEAERRDPGRQAGQGRRGPRQRGPRLEDSSAATEGTKQWWQYIHVTCYK